MGGRLVDVDSAVDYPLLAALVCGMIQWVNNTGAGNITITAPAGCSFAGGGTTMVVAVGGHAMFQNIGGTYIYADVSPV